MNGIVLPASSSSMTAFTCSGRSENSLARMETKSVVMMCIFLLRGCYFFFRIRLSVAVS